MAGPLFIQSRTNPRIKQVAALKEAKHRRATGLFRVEGHHELTIALQYGYEFEALYRISGRNHELPRLADLPDSTQVCEVSASVFEKMSMRQNPDGLLAVCRQRDIPPLPDRFPAATDRILVLESIEKPGNLGAIFRSAAAFGFQTIVLNDVAPDIYHPNVIRNSRGHSLGMKVYRDERENTRKCLENGHYPVWVASPEARENLSELVFGSRTAIVMGNEHDGVSEFWKTQASGMMKIPMTKSVDSLNVSVSASIVLYEVFKQLVSSSSADDSEKPESGSGQTKRTT